jgi:hypothetical protein
MSKITISKEDGLALLDLELDPGRSYCLGRSCSAEIRLKAPSISRTHAVLIPMGGNWVICDLGSRQGTWCSQGRVETMRLNHGDWVALGSAYLWYEDSQVLENPEITTPNMAKAEETPKNKFAVLIEGPSPGLPRVVGLDARRPLTIGTAVDSDVMVKNTENKSTQLGIFPHRGGWQVTSMTSSNLLDRTGLNTRSTPLEPKTTVFAGSLAISVLPVESPARQVVEYSEQTTNLNEQDAMFDSTDLEAAARSGLQRSPNRPTAA